jgi:hypothetical protein
MAPQRIAVSQAAGAWKHAVMGPPRLLLLAAALVLAAFAAPADDAFVDVTVAAGVSYLQHEGNASEDCLYIDFCLMERQSGGAAVADVDADGDLDLFATRLFAPSLLFCNRLVESGQAVFEDCTAGSGIDATLENGNGAAFGDVDRDGDPDLYVTAIGTQRFFLYLNDGSGHFVEDGVARGAAIDTGFTHLGYGVELGDFDRDGWLDVHTNEWASAYWYIIEPGHPGHARLLRNRGAAQPGHFDDVTVAAGVEIPQDDRWQFASALRDVDGDGWSDLAIASDFGRSLLFWSDGDGTFTRAVPAAGIGTDENGMGSTLGDYDADGDLDWFVTSIYDPAGPCGNPPCPYGSTGNRLYRYDGDRTFSDQTGSAAAGVRDGGWGWGTAFFDYDLDGDLDLVMTNGADYPDSAAEESFHDDPMRLWRNDGPDAWTEVSTLEGVTDLRAGKGLLVFDYDEDGDLDVFVVNNASTPLLYQNQTRGETGPHWLRVRVVDALGSDVHGARVTLLRDGAPPQLRVVGSVTHFLGWSDPAAHFGLGASAAPVRVEVRLPGSDEPSVHELSAGELDRTLVVPEPAGGAAFGLAALALLDASRVASRRRAARERSPKATVSS